MTWHILGAGSLGCLWAARLLLAGEDVRLILRPARLQQWQHNQQSFSFTDLQHNTHHLKAAAETADSTGAIHRLLLACKTYAVEDAIHSIRHRLQPGAHVLLLQNGIGSQQAAMSLLPESSVLAGSSTEGAYLCSAFHCKHAGAGHNLFGTLSSQPLPAAILEQLNHLGIPCQWHPDIQSALWRKLAINCLINPLTVLHNCRNGELMQHLPAIKQLADELSRLLQAAGHPESTHGLLATTKQVITRTAANTSSMLQDVQRRRRTEISYITGFAVQQSIALKTPNNHLQALHLALQEHLSKLGLPAY